MLQHSGLKTHLAKQRRLLVASDSGDRHARVEQLVRGFGIRLAGGAHFGQHSTGHVEQFEEVTIPLMGVDVVKQRAAGVADIRDVRAAIRKFPGQPGVDRAECEFSGSRRLPRSVHVIENPLEFRAGEIGVDHEAGFLLNRCGESALFQGIAEVSRPAILPDDGAMNRSAGLAVPDDCGLALVGNSDRRDPIEIHTCLRDDFRHHARLGRPDLFGVVLDPARLRIMLGEFTLGHTADGAGVIEQYCTGTGGALVEGKDELFHNQLVMSAGYKSQELQGSWIKLVRMAAAGA